MGRHSSWEYFSVRKKKPHSGGLFYGTVKNDYEIEEASNTDYNNTCMCISFLIKKMALWK